MTTTLMLEAAIAQHLSRLVYPFPSLRTGPARSLPPRGEKHATSGFKPLFGGLRLGGLLGLGLAGLAGLGLLGAGAPLFGRGRRLRGSGGCFLGRGGCGLLRGNGGCFLRGRLLGRRWRRRLVGGGASAATASTLSLRAARLRGSGHGERRRRDDRRRARVHLEDSEPQDAVGDAEVVVEVAEQLLAGLEAEEAIVGLGPLADLVGEFAHAPRRVVLEAAPGLDPLARLRRDLLPALLRDLRIEHQDELVFPGGCGAHERRTTIAVEKRAGHPSARRGCTDRWAAGSASGGGTSPSSRRARSHASRSCWCSPGW